MENQIKQAIELGFLNGFIAGVNHFRCLNGEPELTEEEFEKDNLQEIINEGVKNIKLNTPSEGKK